MWVIKSSKAAKARLYRINNKIDLTKAVNRIKIGYNYLEYVK
jgi:hypothetical protein|tara:strand:- start:2330 stop:2455 length:126 start_codon:yes stop_codon:yes gene_type:complete